MPYRKGYLLVLACFFLAVEVSETVPVYTYLLEDPNDIQTLVTAASFLANYGFISPEKGNAPPDKMNITEMSTAIKKMQKYADINQTGLLDQDTVKMMKTPRCGVHDEPEEIMDTRIESTGPEEVGYRRRRYAVAGLRLKWDENDLTYKITNYPDSTRSRITQAEVRIDTEQAFQLWSDVTPLSFTKVNDNDNADMKISFGTFYHTDIERDPIFDGPGGTLAHAFYPKSGWGDADGDVHLDDSETFIHHETEQGTNYLYTVAHEIGHALGMAHATDKTSLMFPYNQGYIPDLKLPEDDIHGVQLLYGPNPNSHGVVSDDVTEEHEICRTGISSLTQIKNILYVFSGDKFWKLSPKRKIIDPVDGTLSKDYFQNLKDGSSAVYTRWDGKTVFFRGKNYWVYDDRTEEQTTPLKTTALGVSKAPSAVMHDANQRCTYFFKWSKVWKYNETAQRIVEGFPKATHKIFNGLPRKSKVQAAFIDKAGDQYLLVGTHYYRFANGQDQSDPGYPKDFLVEYFGCRPQ